MPKARNLLRQNTFDPDAAKKMGEVYDHVWTSVEQGYEGRPAAEAELARTALAKASCISLAWGTRTPMLSRAWRSV